MISLSKRKLIYVSISILGSIDMRLLFLLLLTVTIATANTGTNPVQQKDVITAKMQESDSFDQFDDEFAQSDEAAKDVFDPLSGYNRWMTDINDVLMINILEPAADGYRYVVPEGGRESIHKAFKNLYFPVSLVNNLLQLKLKHSANETMRFVINSTIGLLGLFDPAESVFGIKPHVEDFGQTLGFYGVGGGFPVVLPLFGQRNLRDLVGTFADAYVDPLYYDADRFYNTVEPRWQSILLEGYKDFNEYSLTPGAYEKAKEDAIDLYPFLRDAYEQHRNDLIEE